MKEVTWKTKEQKTAELGIKDAVQEAGDYFGLSEEIRTEMLQDLLKEAQIDGGRDRKEK